MDTARRHFPSTKNLPGRTKSSCRRDTPTVAACFPSGTIGMGGPNFGNDPRQMAAGKNGDIWRYRLYRRVDWSVQVPFGGGGYLRAYPLNLTNALFRSLEKNGSMESSTSTPGSWTPAPAVQAPFFRRLRHHIGYPENETEVDPSPAVDAFRDRRQLLDAYQADSNRRPVLPARSRSFTGEPTADEYPRHQL